MRDVLPECRLTHPIGAQLRGGVYWVPVFCAACHKPGGYVPEGVTFAFYLHDECAEKYGQLAGHMMMPDEAFYEKVRQEQLESHGRYLNHNELLQVSVENNTPLATLLNKG